MILDAVPAAWQPLLQSLRHDPVLLALSDFLEAEAAAGKAIYPPREHWFAALEHTRPDDVRVVILGQDPYHGPGQAHGLSFSVPPGVRMPPSLNNIWKELARDFGLTPPQHGTLTRWAEQGVLLLNTVLTVEANKAASHAKRGWEILTDTLIRELAARETGVVFLLWGSHAQKKAALIDRQRHCVLESVHPSPLSAYRGFIGCGHFSAANQYLQQHGRTPIDWAI
ncbi:uracil-DNA glycosylase [Amantichitinum ursilacus]|uniref:Uracil-DNA glycosylase n=1 Tax=Amantichitinum ursilacus TaxID=857265 RepID=A0A0N0XNJ1_9NEIS|nr:uracil-DNA glycosylase [Amantichitinum ursilacus]KPC55232.1 Uracil-DNA glycosylase [Amantichitinum ursilacus]